MPRVATPLTESQIRALQPRSARYSIADGNGLILEVMPTGKKVWRFRYTLGGRRQPMATIGDYQLISLRVARARAVKYMEMVAKGLSPVVTARQDRGIEKRVELVREAAALYVATELARKSDEYRRTTQRAFDKDILPAIGHKAIAQVSAADVQSICDAIVERGAPQMATHTRNVVKRLYAFLIARELVTNNPASAVKPRMGAKPEPRARVLHAEEIGALLRALQTSRVRPPLKLAVHLLLLTMATKSQVIEAKWGEFDVDHALWTIPARRAHNGRERAVPLSPQALATLSELRRITDSRKYLFPSTRGDDDRPISKGTLNQALKTLAGPLPRFVVQDLRRTAQRYMDDAGHATIDRNAIQAWAKFVDDQRHIG